MRFIRSASPVINAKSRIRSSLLINEFLYEMEYELDLVKMGLYTNWNVS